MLCHHHFVYDWWYFLPIYHEIHIGLHACFDGVKWLCDDGGHRARHTWGKSHGQHWLLLDALHLHTHKFFLQCRSHSQVSHRVYRLPHQARDLHELQAQCNQSTICSFKKKHENRNVGILHILGIKHNHQIDNLVANTIWEHILVKCWPRNFLITKWWEWYLSKHQKVLYYLLFSVNI